MSATATNEKPLLDTIEKAEEWLTALHKQVNEKVPTTMRPNMSGGAIHGMRVDVVRGLTEAEWEQVLDIVKEHQLACELGSTFFSWKLRFYGHSPIREEPPEVLLEVRPEQIPSIGKGKNLGEKEVALQDLSALTHSDRNRELLAWYHLDPPREPSYYSY